MALTANFFIYAFVVAICIIPNFTSSLSHHRTIANLISSGAYKNSLGYSSGNAKEIIQVGVLESPGYPSNYPSNINASWLVNAPPGRQLRLIVNNFETEHSENCGNDYLDVYDGNSIWYPHLIRLCGKRGGLWLTSSESELFLVFATDIQYELSGFRLEYMVETENNCNTTVRASEGIIFSPSFSGNADCWTLIETPDEEHQIMITFFHVDGGNNSSYVDFADGFSEDAEPLRRFCDSFNHCSVLSTTNKMTIHFHSDDEFANKGIILNYTSIPAFNPSRNPEAGDCYWESDRLNGTITSPNYPNFYGNNRTCIFLLEAPRDKMISLRVEKIIVEKSDQCAFDYVRVRDSHAEDGQLLAKLCGRLADLNTLVTSTANKMRVTFRSGDAFSFRGFIARYAIVSEAPEGSLCTNCRDDSKIVSREPIRVISHPSNVTLTEGESHLFSCSSSDPDIKTSWMKDLIPLTTGDQIQYPGLTILPNSSLLIKSMSWSMEGSYTCTLMSQSDVKVFNARLTYKPSDKDLLCDIKFIVVPQSDANLVQGMFQFLRCSTSNLNVTITWEKDGDLITPTSNSRLQILLPGLLLVRQLRAEDSGIYTCVATNENNCSSTAKTSLRVIQKPDSVCGVPRITPNRKIGKIAGGSKAIRGTSPWQALLWEKHLLGETAYCGGTLIHRDWVVTAAHCIDHFAEMSGYQLQLDDILVKLGKYDAGIEEPQEQILKVQNIITHPEYDNATYDNDITLLRLKSPAEFSTYVLPLCIAKPEFLNRYVYNSRNHGLVTGWGRASMEGPPQRYLKEVYLPIIDEETCNKSVEGRELVVTENMFCAGYARRGSAGSCKGDSGGPFAVELNHVWYLAGIVSWGDGCSTERIYEFHTKVGNYYRWMYDTIQNNGNG